MGRAFDSVANLPSGTISVTTAVIISFNDVSGERLRRQDLITSTNNTSFNAYLDVVLQAFYPRQCFHVLQCQKLFRQRVLSIFLNLKSYVLPFPLLDGRVVDLPLQLADLTQYYVLPASDESTTTINTISSQQTTARSVTSSTVTTSTTTCHPSSGSSWQENGTTIFGDPAGTSGSDLMHLTTPYALYYDSMNTAYIIAEFGNRRVLKFSVTNPSSPGTVIAGDSVNSCGTTSFKTPTGASLDSAGQLYVTDASCNRLVRFPANSNSATAGTDISTSLNSPQALSIDPRTNDIYVVSSGDNVVYKFTGGNGSPTVVAGSGSSGSTTSDLKSPAGVYFDYSYTNSLYVSDTGNYRVLKYPSNSVQGAAGTVVAGGNGNGNGLNQIGTPRGVIVDSSGDVYVVDRTYARILRWTVGANNSALVAGTTSGTAANQLKFVTSVIFSPQGDLVVADTNNHRIQLFSLSIC
ncbi:unnamed protein product [Adineta ricciae]|uniref:NHL repeat containing protein n=1 Tax=Adineta ricciae TaxID=249248 RepID=A0A814K1N9_ADIRI|nr:unnamed protein product [Adineta ricciae]CAF1516431.1 unnamed protein product [Adineta ricciae]